MTNQTAKSWNIGDEVIVLKDIYGNGLYDFERIGNVTAVSEFYVSVKGLFFSKWYPLNSYYLICKVTR